MKEKEKKEKEKKEKEKKEKHRFSFFISFILSFSLSIQLIKHSIEKRKAFQSFFITMN
jgi:hypothetical protein